MPYGFYQKIQRLEGWAKMGIISKKKPFQSLGILISAGQHQQDAFYGLNDYQGVENFLTINSIFQTEITDQHRFRLGASYILDSYDELYQVNHLNPASFDRARLESVPGVFGEYTWQPSEKFTLVPGIRADFHNLYGTFVSPRLHLKYKMTGTTIVRLSGGRGFRIANPLIENAGFLVSSRALSIAPNLNPEIAWNYGGSISQKFTIASRVGTIVADFYRTDFENQIVTDLDANTQEIRLYNLDGNAYANSFQITIDYQLVKGLDMSLAYKWYDVKTTIDGVLRDAPFVARNRALLNLGYTTRHDKWSFDFTTQWFGTKRLPDSVSNPEEFQIRARSPHYFIFNTQITRRFKKWEVYAGGENLGSFQQTDPIVDYQNPYSTNFDAGMTWAPVMGRVIYAGLRFTID